MPSAVHQHHNVPSGYTSCGCSPDNSWLHLSHEAVLHGDLLLEEKV